MDYTYKAKEYSLKTFTPKRDNVLIKVAESEKRTKGGLYIPEIAQEKNSVGEVVRIGTPRITEFGVEIPIPLKIGDIVLFSKFSGQEVLFKEDDDDYKIIASDLIFGVFEEVE